MKKFKHKSLRLPSKGSTSALSPHADGKGSKKNTGFVYDAHSRLRAYEDVLDTMAKGAETYAKSLSKCKGFGEALKPQLALTSAVGPSSSSSGHTGVGSPGGSIAGGSAGGTGDGSSAQNELDSVSADVGITIDAVLRQALETTALHQVALEDITETLQQAIAMRFALPLRQVLKDELEDGRQAKKRLEAARTAFEKGDKAPAEKLRFEDSEVEAAASFADATWRTEVTAMSRLSLLWKAQASYFSSGLAVAEAAQQQIAELGARLAESGKGSREGESRTQFGVPLTDLCRSGNRLPRWVTKCFDLLDTKGVKVEGIFRINASMTVVGELRQQLNAGIEPAFDRIDAHTIAQLIKVFLRELPMPLLTYDLYDDWISAAKTAGEAPATPEVIDLLRDLVRILPEPHKLLLYRVVRFAATVASHVEETRMTASSIAIAFGPNVLRKESGQDLTFKEGNKVMELLTENFSAVFGADEESLGSDKNENPNTNKTSGGDTVATASSSVKSKRPTGHRRTASSSKRSLRGTESGSRDKRGNSGSTKRRSKPSRNESDRVNLVEFSSGASSGQDYPKPDAKREIRMPNGEEVPASDSSVEDDGLRTPVEPGGPTTPTEVPPSTPPLDDLEEPLNSIPYLRQVVEATLIELAGLSNAAEGVPLILAVKGVKENVDSLRELAPVDDPLEFDRSAVLQLTTPLEKLRHTLDFALRELVSFVDAIESSWDMLDTGSQEVVTEDCRLIAEALMVWREQ